MLWCVLDSVGVFILRDKNYLKILFFAGLQSNSRLWIYDIHLPVIHIWLTWALKFGNFRHSDPIFVSGFLYLNQFVWWDGLLWYALTIDYHILSLKKA